MSSNKRKDTGPELILRKALRDADLSGYRLQWKVPGKPDIAYPGKKLAIFVNGCFWHRCPKCDLPVPKSNTDFWKTKFDNNVCRDAEKKRQLEDAGWTVLVVWECEIRDNVDDVLLRIENKMG